MIPYFEQPHIPLGPITIHGFGLLVAAAVLLGAALIRRRARKLGLDVPAIQRLVTWVVIGGFIGAHLVDRFVYFPRQTLEEPFSLLRPWEGLSSFGGFLGAIVGIRLFLRRHPLQPMWPYLDTIAWAFPFAWVIGRLGCFIAYDHPGSPTTFFLGQTYRDGIVRHNLGFEEALYSAVIAAIFLLLSRRDRQPGFFVAWLAILYAPFRFSLDFLRKIDVRYLGLTPGQYGAALLLVAGVVLLVRALRDRPSK